MRNFAEMKNRFLVGFNEQQSELLAEFVVETYDDLATRRDFAELREVVADLAASEKRLAIAQERTETRVEELPVAQKETQAELIKLAASHEKLAASHDRLAASHEQTQSDVHELTHISREVLWSLGDLRKQVGSLSNSVGQGLEAYAMERIPRILEQRFGFVTESSAPENIGDDGEEYAFDVVYRGTLNERRVVVLCEVKTNITITEVEDFLSVAMRANRHLDTLDVRTLFFGYRVGHKAQQLIADHRALLAFPRGLVVS